MMFIVFLTILSLGIYFYLDSGHFKKTIKETIITSLEPMIEGKVHLNSIQGNLFRDFEIKEFSIQSQHGEWLEIPSVKIKWNSSSLWNKKLVIKQIEINNPNFTLRYLKSGELDLPFKSKTGPQAPSEENKTLELPIYIHLEELLINNFTLKKEYKQKISLTKNIQVKLTCSGQSQLNTSLNISHDSSKVELNAAIDLPKANLKITRLNMKSIQPQLYFDSPIEIVFDLNCKAEIPWEKVNNSLVDSKIDISFLEFEQMDLGKHQLNLLLEKQKLKASNNWTMSSGHSKTYAQLNLEDLNWRLTHQHEKLNLSTVIPQSDIQSNLNFILNAKGKGFDINKDLINASLKLSKSKIIGIPIDNANITANTENGMVVISELNLNAIDTQLSGKAKYNFKYNTIHDTEIQLDCSKLEHWQAFTPVELSGDATLDIKAEHQHKLNHITANFKSNNLSINNSTLQNTTLNLSGTLNQEFDAKAKLQLNSGLLAITQEGTAKLKLLEPIILCNIQKTNTTISGLIQQISFTHKGNNFINPENIKLKIDYPEISINTLKLDSLQQKLSFSTNGNLDKNFNAKLILESFDPNPWVQDWVKLENICKQIDIESQWSGNLQSPNTLTSIKVYKPQYKKQSLDSLTANISFQSGKVSTHIKATSISGEYIEFKGHALGQAQLSPSFNHQGFKEFDLEIKSSSIALKPWQTLAQPHLEYIEGSVKLDCIIKGNIEQFTPKGNISFENIAFKSNQLDDNFENINFNIDIDDKEWNIEPFQIKLGTGNIILSANAQVNKKLPEVILVSLQSNNIPLKYKNMVEARLSNNLQIKASKDQLDIKGNVEIPECLLKPDLAFLNRNISERDPSIIILEEINKNIEEQLKKEKTKPFNTILDLDIAFPRNIRVIHDKIKTELGGHIKVKKEIKDKELKLLGNIKSKRGQLKFLGQSFKIVQSKVNFQGPASQPPILDIQAESIIKEYKVTIQFKGPSDKPELILNSNPNLSQADILSLLTFGNTMNNLGSGEKKSFGERANEFASGFAASKLQEFLRDEFDLDSLGIELDDIAAEDGSIGLGKYINDKTFISVNQKLRDKSGRTYRIEREVRKNIKLVTERDSEGNNGIDFIFEKKY